MNDGPSQKRDADQERIRLLEFQLDYLRAEMLHLTNERYRLIYSVSGHIYRFLRPIESRLADILAVIMPSLRPRKDHASIQTEEATSLPDDFQGMTKVSVATTLPARRLLIDVTGTVQRDAGTGIQRVVKEIVRAFYADDDRNLPAIAVRCENGRLLAANAFVASLSGGSAARMEADPEIEIAPGDRFLMLSDSWNAFEILAPVIAAIRANGGEIISCIFDLIPELHPWACHEVTVPRYRAWLRRGLIESDGFIAISQTVADELADYVEQHRLPHRQGLKIGWFHCGADIPVAATRAPRDRICAAVSGAAPAFLSVGTIEPRKGHRVALAAFECLWREGVSARLVIVGRRGWFEEAVVATITGHAEFGRRLFWLDDVEDSELAYLYENVAALVLPSFAEGFGLPIVEAARHGRPVICSDIPVFREVGRDGAAYFHVNDPDALAATIRKFLAGQGGVDPQRALQVTWRAAARRIADVLTREDWRRRLA
jgi:glycosyltransferase involved in cell wall biosynthesis